VSETRSKRGLIKTDASITDFPPPPPDNGVRVDERVPDEFGLEQNYPNPFNPVTVIRYALPNESMVRLTIFNILGEEIKTLADGVQKPGYRTAAFDGSELPSGVYFYRLEAVSVAGPGKSFTSVKKMVLMK
jgi:hypothetical protein